MESPTSDVGARRAVSNYYNNVSPFIGASKLSHTPEELLNAILLCFPEGYVASNEFGKIVFVNEVIEKITGWSSKELVGQDISKLFFLPEGSVQLDSDSDNVNPQPAVLFQRNGQKITLKSRQVEIKKINNSSSKKKFAGYLTVFSIDKYSDKNLERAQIEFVSTVSHELRTPLTSIKGFADTLLSSGEKLSEENKKKYITIIKEQSDRLIRLVEDLLAVSRLESNRYQLTIRALDLKKYIDKVCEHLSSRSSTHKIIQNVEDNLPNIWADADKLEQILTNLLDNAIKYSPGKSDVIITASGLPADAVVKDKVKIEVIDKGVGISKVDLEKIFTKFGRLDNPMTRQTQGTGLGLFITKSLVLELKGEISVKSKPGETIFTFVLPAVVPETALTLSFKEEVSEN